LTLCADPNVFVFVSYEASVVRDNLDESAHPVETSLESGYFFVRDNFLVDYLNPEDFYLIGSELG